MRILPDIILIEQYVLKKAVANDAEKINNIKNSCFYLFPFDENFYISETQEHIDIIARSHLEENKLGLYCIMYNNETIGFLYVLYDVPEHGSIWITSLIIHPKYQRNRIGRKIILHLEKVFSEIGYRNIQLRVYIKNFQALRFWISVGFSTIVNFQSEDSFEEFSNRASFVLVKNIENIIYM